LNRLDEPDGFQFISKEFGRAYKSYNLENSFKVPLKIYDKPKSIHFGKTYLAVDSKDDQFLLISENEIPIWWPRELLKAVDVKE
jgi:hypothetical protein